VPCCSTMIVNAVVVVAWGCEIANAAMWWAWVCEPTGIP
jgi:hypothetical protein